MKRRFFVLLALMFALLLVTVAGASADNGDGQEACNYGEICLYRFGTTERYTKHFWHNASYDGYQWWDTVDNVYTGAVGDTTSGVRNRDTVCEVRLINVRAWWPDESYDIPNDGWFHDLRWVFDDKADKHERVSCG